MIRSPAESATLIVGRKTQYLVKVSPEDFEFLSQFRWTFAVSHPRYGGLVYARRSIRCGDYNITVLMHRVVLAERMGIERPSPHHFVDHANGDSLDNRRVNDEGDPQLRWLTHQENMMNRRGVRAVPFVAENSIPF